MPWAGRNIKSGVSRLCVGIGSSFAVPFPISWYHQAPIPAAEPPAASAQRAPAAQQDREELQGSQRAEGKKGACNVRTTTDLAQSETFGQSLARTLGLAPTLLASVVSTAPISPTPATRFRTFVKGFLSIFMPPFDPCQQSSGRR
jgi:hypothetical protein